MKKVNLLLFSVLLNIFFVISNGKCKIFNPNSAMTENNFYLNQYVQYGGGADTSKFSMKKYFYGLNDYSPKNSLGSCGYVSFIQYLSYYDTFYNDDIIPGIYERSNKNSLTVSDANLSSPGVLRQDYPRYGFHEYVNQNSDVDFQMKLMKVYNDKTDNWLADDPWSIGMWSYQIILDELYSNDISFEYTDYRDLGSSSTPLLDKTISYFDSYVKTNLDSGKPVILHIGKYNTSGIDEYHSVVAYYYDSIGIHCNYGWGTNSTDIVIPSDFQIIQAGIVDFSVLPEKHSNNYIVNGDIYCGCNSLHSHDLVYKCYNSDYHTQECNCGYSTGLIEKHILGRVPSIGNSRYVPCALCGYPIDLWGPGMFPILNLNNDYLFDPLNLLG